MSTHMETGLVHRVGDVDALTQHITMLHENRPLLERLRASSLGTAHEITWTAAGETLLQIYRNILAEQTSRLHSNVTCAVPTVIENRDHVAETN
jgi:hypothetical protein